MGSLPRPTIKGLPRPILRQEIGKSGDTHNIDIIIVIRGDDNPITDKIALRAEDSDLNLLVSRHLDRGKILPRAAVGAVTKDNTQGVPIGQGKAIPIKHRVGVVVGGVLVGVDDINHVHGVSLFIS